MFLHRSVMNINELKRAKLGALPSQRHLRQLCREVWIVREHGCCYMVYLRDWEAIVSTLLASLIGISLCICQLNNAKV